MQRIIDRGLHKDKLHKMATELHKIFTFLAQRNIIIAQEFNFFLHKLDAMLHKTIANCLKNHAAGLLSLKKIVVGGKRG